MNDVPLAKTKPASSWSAVWILPIIALLIGGWLGWRAYSEAGIKVEVVFASGEGIQAGKTELIYKGISVGKVTEVSLDSSKDTTDVSVVLEVSQHVRDYLRKGTQFWLVKPSVSLAGITGLETLVSGNYITFSPGDIDGSESHRFVALDREPPFDGGIDGLHLTLKAKTLGSISRDSPVFFKELQVGRVTDYRLADDQQSVEIQVFIEKAYTHLVRKHSRFWNASGISVEAGLSGVKIRTESLASIVAGGIAFATPEHSKDSPEPDAAQTFRLYEDYEEAQTGIKITLTLTDFDGLQEGRTPVLYKGLQMGMLKSMTLSPDLRSATAELIMHPRTEDYLREGAEFWVVKPSISLGGITGLEALVKGNYIAMRPSETAGALTRDFTARENAPPLDLGAPGLHLALFSDQVGSIAVDSPVLYRQLRVGTVQSYQLARDDQQVVFGVHIEPEYAHLVNSSTRFWNASGITLKGSFSGIEIKSESLQTLLTGGIAFDTPNLKAQKNADRVQRFALHSSQELAQQAGELIRLQLLNADGLQPGAPLRYKGLEVGKVQNVSLSENLRTVQASVLVTQAAAQIAREGSQFWLVKPEISLSGAANLDTLVTGPYLQVQPATKAGAKRSDFTALLSEPVEVADQAGLRIVLSAERRNSLKAGSQVTYREVPVGQVVDVALGPTADRVLVHVLIEPRYAPLVRTGSRFWNASGIGMHAGLFSGIEVRTESLEAIIAGGVAFATPNNAEMGNAALPRQTFALFDEPQEHWLKWAPKIQLAQ